jgi:putative ABC transport system ATP-binding protein
VNNTVAPAVHIQNLEFRYRPQLPVVLQLREFKVESGQHCFLYGPSGCGKSTLLSLIAGVLAPVHGEVNVLGRPLHQLSGAQRDRLRGEDIGYIFQMFNLIPYLSVLENIILGCRLHSRRRARLGTVPVETAARRMAASLGIEDLLPANVTQLSVGQQQRVAVARALLGAPPLLIADEPTSALDANHREQFLRLLLEQAAEAKSTVLFVSHDESLAAHFPLQVRLPELMAA